MIKIDELRDYRPKYRYTDGAGITLDMVKEELTAEAKKNGIPVAFYDDQVKSGGMFNKTIEDCIVMYHPEHRNDYYRFCIRVQREGSLTFISVNDFGDSKQMDKFARAEYAKQDRSGKSMSYKLGSMAASAIANSGRNKQKLEAEQNYYDAVQYIFDTIIS